jgi:hypothetical protein
MFYGNMGLGGRISRTFPQLNPRQPGRRKIPLPKGKTTVVLMFEGAAVSLHDGDFSPGNRTIQKPDVTSYCSDRSRGSAFGTLIQVVLTHEYGPARSMRRQRLLFPRRPIIHIRDEGPVGLFRQALR